MDTYNTLTTVKYSMIPFSGEQTHLMLNPGFESYLPVSGASGFNSTLQIPIHKEKYSIRDKLWIRVIIDLSTRSEVPVVYLSASCVPLFYSGPNLTGLRCGCIPGFL